ncbi:MAG: HEPN domain-containing protein [Promethearchaeota archaeon]
MKRNFNPEIFLEIAKKIKDCTTFNEDGILRTSVGRAYYAAFLTIRSRLELKGFSYNSVGQHSDVRDNLKDLGYDTLANFLEELFNKRVVADYNLKKSIDHKLCEYCILLSEEIINYAEDISVV